MSLNSDKDDRDLIIKCHKCHENSALLPTLVVVSVAEEVAARLSNSSQKVMDDNPMTLEQAQKLKNMHQEPHQDT